MKITANMVTIVRIVLMPIPGYLLYGSSNELIAALAAIVVLGLTDWLDGIMARREGPSLLGGLLDPIADKIFIAAIYLPLTERGIIPIWMTGCIFARDFLVTALRTSLSLRDAPMRTSTLAKFKTAMQMIGICYVIIYQAFIDTPDSMYVWFLISIPMAFPFSLILYRLVRREKQGLRSITMICLMALAVGIRVVLGPAGATLFTLYVITAITVISGFSYLVDAWSALKGTPGGNKELMRFALDGLAVPISTLLLLGRFDAFGMSLSIILIYVLELSVGGLGNLLGSRKITPLFRLITIKSLLQVLLAASALAISVFDLKFHFPLGETCIVLCLGVTIAYAAFSFWRHRAVYLAII